MGLLRTLAMINDWGVTKERVETLAVVGFVDIISSARISNAVDLETEWRMKELFFKAASTRALECGLTVLNHTGDGFLFTIEHEGRADWYASLLNFHQSLAADFAIILESLRAKIGHVDSGIRIGVSCGNVMIGALGGRHFTAIGPDVNLAARLCAQAAPNEIVVSSRAWYRVRETAHAPTCFESRVYRGLKGFDSDVPAVHIKPFETDLVPQARA